MTWLGVRHAHVLNDLMMLYCSSLIRKLPGQEWCMYTF